MSLSVVKSEAGLTVVALDGRLDAGAVEEIRERFLAETTSRGHPVVVDVAGVTFLASLGIWMFVEAAKALQPHGAKLALVGPQPLVEKSLRASGFAAMVGIHPDLRDAERALRSP